MIRPYLFAGACFAVFLVGTAWGRAALAADHTNLDEDLPVTVTDAYPVNYLERDVEALFAYERSHAGENILRLEPRFEIGFPRNAQFTVKVPGVLVTNHDPKLGQVQVEELYDVNEETLVIPALAVVVGADLPTGVDRTGETAHGVDPFVAGYLTKTIPGTMLLQRINFNVTWQWNLQRQPAERAGRYIAVAGYDVRLSTSAIGIVDVVREQEISESRDRNVAEIGLRYMLNPLTVIGIGGGVGFGDDSPRGRATIFAQYYAF